LFPYVKKSVNLFFVIFLRREVPMVGVDLRQSLCISALEAIAQLPATEEKVPLVPEATLVGRNRKFADTLGVFLSGRGGSAWH
jgi:hypothetical protein